MNAALRLAISAPDWLTGVGSALTGVAALTALVLVGWSERRRLLSRHHHDERRKLQELIGRYHGRLVEAAVDWDRRMRQLYESKPAPPEWDPPEGFSEVEFFLHDQEHYEKPATYIHGKFLNPDEYLFRSWVYRFLALCGLARRFEREAFYIHAKVARPSDFQFLKYAKSFIWAVTNSDLHDDVIPSKDHFPNDEFRPILDACYAHPAPRQAASGDYEPGPSGTIQPIPVFDLARLEELAKEDYAAHLVRLRELNQDRGGDDAQRPAEPEGDQSGDSAGGGELENPDQATSGQPPPARGVGRVILFFIGLQKDKRDEHGRLRYNRDRLCVLHLLVMSFINEFGYPWQALQPAHFDQAVNEIVDPNVCKAFARAIPSLGLLDRSGSGLIAFFFGARRSHNIKLAPMEYVQRRAQERGQHAGPDA